jgi:hypothetical protein
MTIEDIIRLAREAGMPEWLQEDWFAGPFDSFALRFAYLVAAAEREACASIEVHLTTPDRDYTTMSPLDAYEAALMDAAIAFREAIRARGQG